MVYLINVLNVQCAFANPWRACHYIYTQNHTQQVLVLRHRSRKVRAPAFVNIAANVSFLPEPKIAHCVGKLAQQYCGQCS